LSLCAEAVAGLAAATAARSAVPVVVSAQTGDPWPEVAEFAAAHDIALLRGMRTAMRALASVAGWCPRIPNSPGTTRAVDLDDLLAPGALPEFESGVILERYGVPIARRVRATSRQSAAEAAEALGYPVVVKIDGPAHKSADGGVLLGLWNTALVEDAVTRLGGTVLVAEQVPAGPEIICGAVRDPDYGPVLTLGPGGAFAELAGGDTFALAPLGVDDAVHMVRDAFGDQAWLTEQHQAALSRVLLSLSDVMTNHEEIESVDINPVVIQELGVVGVDALVTVRSLVKESGS
jgi:acetyltransferase